MEKIQITHFVNPHLFWFKIIPAHEQLEHVETLERKIRVHHKQFPQSDHLYYKIGDFVTLYYVPWSKHVRGVVKEIMEGYRELKYIVWLIDHGFPVYTNNKMLKFLPDELSEPIQLVQRGGLSHVIPTEIKYDDMYMMEPIEKLSDEWSPRACKILKSLMSESNSVYMKMHFIKRSTGHIWCELKIKTATGESGYISELLSELKLCKLVETDEFKRVCSNFQTLEQTPWFNLNGSSNYYDNVSNKQYISHVEPIEAMWDDELHPSKCKVDDWLQHNFQQTAANAAEDTAAMLLDNDNTIYSQRYRSNVNKDTSGGALECPDDEYFKMYDGKANTKTTADMLLYEQKQKNIGSNIQHDSSVQKDADTQKYNQNNTATNIRKIKKSVTAEPQHVQEQFKMDTQISAEKNDMPQLILKTKLNFTNVVENDEPYVSPFEDKYLRPQNGQETKTFGRLLPAGFDVTQLIEYRNPNHWHRVKTTRNIFDKHDDESVYGNRNKKQEKAWNNQVKDDWNELSWGAQDKQLKQDENIHIQNNPEDVRNKPTKQNIEISSNGINKPYTEDYAEFSKKFLQKESLIVTKNKDVNEWDKSFIGENKRINQNEAYNAQHDRINQDKPFQQDTENDLSERKKHESQKLENLTMIHKRQESKVLDDSWDLGDFLIEKHNKNDETKFVLNNSDQDSFVKVFSDI